jgi:hypothetical protein
VKSCLSYAIRYFPEPSTVVPLPWSDPKMLRLVNTKEKYDVFVYGTFSDRHP